MFLKDFIFPKICVGCGFVGSYICLKCQKKLILINKDRCMYCGKLAEYGLTHYGCRKINGIDGISALYKYNNMMQKIIKTIKYRLATDVWKELCMIASVEAENKWRRYKLIINNIKLQPIPLYKDRERLRGFNQAQFVARLIQPIFGGVIVNKLKRVKNTLPQAEQDKNIKRYINVKHAFKGAKDNIVPGSKIVLIDDIYTSGATMMEAAKALKQAGTSFVYGITLARG